MVGGESSRETVQWRIQEYLFRNGPSRATDIVKNCGASEATGYKYLDELCKEEKVIWRPKRKRGKSTYELSNETKDEMKLLMEKQEIKKKIDQMTPREMYAWKMFGAAFELLVERKVFDALNEGREHITSDELMQLFKDVMRKYRAPKVGNLYPREAGVVRDKEGKIKGKAIALIGGEVPIKKREKEES